MYKNTILILTFLAMPVLLCLGLRAATAQTDSGVVETGRLLAILLDSGRVAIGLHQQLINDPDKGDKGFTPEVFEKQLMKLFKERTGHDLANLKESQAPEMAKPLLARLLEESRKTVGSYQTVINLKGMRYKGLIPATFGTETGTRFQTWSGVYLKQTAPDELLRNPKNKADKFETAIMNKFADSGHSSDGEAVFSEIEDEGKAVRVMLPLFYGKACLSCHGEPKGERDISGYTKEGAREGQLGGAISVKLKLP